MFASAWGILYHLDEYRRLDFVKNCFHVSGYFQPRGTSKFRNCFESFIIGESFVKVDTVSLVSLHCFLDVLLLVLNPLNLAFSIWLSTH